MLRVLLVFFIFQQNVFADELNEKMKSFSYAIKAAHCHSGFESTVYEHTSGGPGVITEQWYTGQGCFDNKTIVRYYIDGDLVPTIEANLFMMHGIGFYDEKIAAWGTKWIGHTANNGGLYNTYRIPFQKSIRVTFVPQSSAYYWYIVRGVENYPIIIGDLKLPSTAKLVLHKLEDKLFPPLAYIPLATTDKRGIVFSLSLRGDSKSFMYLEGCFGTVTKRGNKTVTNFLSSGTEDMFLSAYYYNKGVFHTDDSGLTYLKYPGMMSAYKFFHQDPVIINGGVFSLLWRASENNGGCWVDTNDTPSKDEKIRFHHGAESVDIDPNGYIPVKISSYVWTYEW